jgi:hypothetical protein
VFVAVKLAKVVGVAAVVRTKAERPAHVRSDEPGVAVERDGADGGSSARQYP